jgi:hypothetical protein
VHATRPGALSAGELREAALHLLPGRRTARLQPAGVSFGGAEEAGRIRRPLLCIPAIRSCSL